MQPCHRRSLPSPLFSVIATHLGLGFADLYFVGLGLGVALFSIFSNQYRSRLGWGFPFSVWDGCSDWSGLGVLISVWFVGCRSQSGLGVPIGLGLEQAVDGLGLEQADLGLA
uniref:Uncharacterized protein n=1 Tax=Fagus sylvatica TaxID=28930 RepID=A0A2N9G626_FAGSY